MSHPLLGLLRTAVTEALQGDNVALVCSGGIDSSSVACLAAEHGRYPLYTGYYDEPGFDERIYAHLVPGEHNHDILITPEDFVENFDRMVPWLRPPYEGMGTFGQFMVAKAMADDGISIALSGEGSDELFGGYARLMIVAGERAPDGFEHYKLPADYPRDLEEALEWEMAHLPALLAVDEQVLAAHGIEGRAPFTHPAVVKYALDLLPRRRLNKQVLKEAMRGIVPPVILNRTDKMGFPIPLVKWAQQEPVRSFVADRIGWLPNPDQPWDRGWWYEMLAVTEAASAVA